MAFNAEKFLEGIDPNTQEGYEAAHAKLNELMAQNDRKSFQELYDLLHGGVEGFVISPAGVERI